MAGLIRSLQIGPDQVPIGPVVPALLVTTALTTASGSMRDEIRPVGEPAPAPRGSQSTPLESHSEAEADSASLARQAVEVRRKAEEEGFKEGLRKGNEQAEKRLAGSIERVGRLIDSLGQQSGKVLDGIDAAVFELVFDATCKVLGEAAVSRDGVQGAVDQVLAKARDNQVLRLRLNPSDIEVLLDQKDGGKARFEGVELLPDLNVESGCVVETTSGSLDGRLEIQLRAFADCLRTMRGLTK